MPALAEAIILSILAATDVTEDLRLDIDDLPSVDSYVNDGQLGGTATVQVRGTGDYAGFMIVDYDEFRVSKFLYDGRFVIEQFGREGGRSNARISFYDLSVSTASSGVTYSGYMARTGSVDDYVLEGSLSARTAGTGVELYMKDMSVQRTRVRHDRALDGTGMSGTVRVHDFRYGWVDVSFENPWVMAPGDFLPTYGGPVRAQVPDGSAFLLRSLAGETAGLRYVDASTGGPPRVVRVRWDTPFGSQMGQAPLTPVEANAGNDASVPLGTPVALRPDYSVTAEPRFVDTVWDIIARPPDSAAEIDFTDPLQPTLTPDKVGDYIVRLSVTDGQSSDVDLAYISGRHSYGATLEPPPEREVQFGPDESVPDGTDIVLDEPYIVPWDVEPEPPRVRVTVTDIGRTDIQVDAVAGTPLTLSLPSGIHELRTDGPGWTDAKLLAVGRPLSHTGPASFWIGDAARYLRVGDLNRDGISDVVYVTAPFSQHTLTVLESNDAGNFVETSRFAVDPLESLALGDVSGDGVPEIVTFDRDAVRVYTRLASGGYSDPDVLEDFTRVPFGDAVTLADLDGDQVEEIVVLDSYDLYELRYRPSEGFTVRTVAPVDVRIDAIQAGDIDNDGRDDIVLAHANSGNDSYIMVMPGPAAPGSAFQRYEIERSPWGRITMALGDIDGDDADEIVATFRERDPSYAAELRVYDLSSDALTASLARTSRVGDVWSITILDFDQDGRMDVGVSGHVGFSVNYQAESGEFDEGFPWLHMRHDIVRVGEFNGDGVPDLVSRAGVHSDSLAFSYGLGP